MEGISKKFIEKNSPYLIHFHPTIFYTILLSFIPTIIHPITIRIQIISFSNWTIYLDLIGFIFPVLICMILIVKKHIHIKFLLISLLPVSLMSYLMTTPILEKGIISPFPLWMFPPLMVGVLVVLNKSILRNNLYSYAFILGVFGVIIGADIGHLPMLLHYTSTTSMHAIFGGAGVFDLIFLSGFFSILFVKLLSIIQKVEKITISKDYFI
jgi:uncharacterized membrane protein